jgi:hypothetical protein
VEFMGVWSEPCVYPGGHGHGADLYRHG